MFGFIAFVIASALAVELAMRKGGKFGELFQSSDLKNKASDWTDDLKNKASDLTESLKSKTGSSVSKKGEDEFSAYQDSPQYDSTKEDFTKK